MPDELTQPSDEMLGDPAPHQIIMYGHNACPQVPPVAGALRSAGAHFEYVNIHRDADARLRVREINAGNETVPTLVFPDGSILTEPTGDQLYKKLRSMGYKVPITTWLIGNVQYIILAAALLYAALAFFGVV